MSRLFMRCQALVALALSAHCVLASVGTAQPVPAAGPQRASRAELAQLAATIETAVNTGRLKGNDLAKERDRLAAVRRRLEVGDFQVGDRFVLTLRHDSVRSDTASVRDSLIVSLLALPDMSVAGVLRSELDERLTAHVSRYLRNAAVRANVFTRVAVTGAVASPGFYYAPPDRPLSDLLMLAGGPAADAKLNELEVHRGLATILKARDSRRAIETGMTLEQLDVQSGDEVRIPQKKPRRLNFQTVVQLLVFVSTLGFALLNFLQWYYNRQDG